MKNPLMEDQIIGLLKKVSGQLEEISLAQVKMREEITHFYQEMKSLHQKNLRELEEQLNPNHSINSMLN